MNEWGVNTGKEVTKQHEKMNTNAASLQELANKSRSDDPQASAVSIPGFGHPHGLFLRALKTTTYTRPVKALHTAIPVPKLRT